MSGALALAERGDMVAAMASDHPLMKPGAVAAARKALGLTQAQLALVMGYGDKVRVSELERGARAASPAAARLIQAYLDGYRPADWPEGR